jgi:acetylornithine deacetylase/succinyl-diaminopimelate desuccinylase-like protein
MKMSRSLQPPTSILSNASRTVGVWVGLAVLTVALPWTADTQAAASSAQSRHINAERLQGTLEKLSEFGRNPEGGVTRLAVHDAGEISRLAPMGMIFVPSRDGISHAPQEFSTWDDVANGTEVLHRSILKLDKQMNAR